MPKKNNTKEEGKIVSLFAGVAKITGLPRVFSHELLVDKNGEPAALVIGFDEEYTEAIFFDESFDPNNPVFRGHENFSIKISDTIVGRVINGSGKPLDDFGPLSGKKRRVFTEAPQIIEREPVSTPLFTGIKIIDATLPIGRGQRELIIGDRKLGKSTLAIDAVLNQKSADPSVFCIYVLCGQKERKLEELAYLFGKNNAFLYTTIVAATANSTFAEKYLAPFVGSAIGEYLRDQGKDALVVYDDLTQHAKTYRDISLLLERPPGREAYPGDIFSLHSGLLERAANLSREKGGGSLTALPIVETQEGDITSFVPTNLISITDGQIYFERGLFQKGFLPAVNIGLSVSRVGSKAQPEALRQVTGGLRIALAQHKELQKLAQIETTKSEEATRKIHRGKLLLEILKQEKHTNVSWGEQTVLFHAVEEGHFDDLVEGQWKNFEKYFLELIENRYFELFEDIKRRGVTPANEKKINDAISDFKEEFLS